IDFCAEFGFSGVDATGYYFPGYPKPPLDEYVYKLKRRAFINGITFGGTGVRNDFAVADAAARKRDVQLVKNWIEVAQKLGATELRVFSGREVPSGYSFDQALKWMAADFRECARYAGRHGVMLGLQNHHDFLKTAAQTIRLVDAVDSEWFAVKLDIGSLRQGDPYQEIETLTPYAVSWQIKENIWH
ncbi:MAG: sugar phosphate isomerase/epimerase, partial [bacterium]|nr:sugar phosphate isomerase/epimerase [bacterium]